MNLEYKRKIIRNTLWIGAFCMLGGLLVSRYCNLSQYYIYYLSVTIIVTLLIVFYIGFIKNFKYFMDYWNT
jgi:uncharacterized membrane protein